MKITKKTLEEIVDAMIGEPNHNPRDNCFRFFVNRYPNAVHDAFDFPGKYQKKLGLKILTDDNRELEMDCAQLIEPEGDITCKSTINVEHQTYPIKKKIDTIYDYKIGLIHQNNIPSNSIVMTNINMGGDYLLCTSHDQTFKLLINQVTIEKISKRLKILKDKVGNNYELSLDELMYIPYIAIFVDDNAKEIMKELSRIFSNIDQINPDLEKQLHQHLKNLIKFHFRDNDDECKEMLTMITKNLYENDYEGLTYKESLELQIKEQNLKIEQIIKQKDQQLEQKDLQIEQIREQNDQQMEQIEQLLQEIKYLKKLNSK